MVLEVQDTQIQIFCIWNIINALLTSLCSIFSLLILEAVLMMTPFENTSSFMLTSPVFRVHLYS